MYRDIKNISFFHPHKKQRQHENRVASVRLKCN